MIMHTNLKSSSSVVLVRISVAVYNLISRLGTGHKYFRILVKD